jgi:hypothetical protein
MWMRPTLPVRTVAGQFGPNLEGWDGKTDLEVASVIADLSTCSCAAKVKRTKKYIAAISTVYGKRTERPVGPGIQ